MDVYVFQSSGAEVDGGMAHDTSCFGLQATRDSRPRSEVILAF